MQKIAVIAAVQRAHGSQNGSNVGDVATNPADSPDYNGSSSSGKSGGRFDADLHGNVNILLGGAMISGVIMVVVLICYCCHKNVRKHRPQEYSQYWRAEPDVHSLEVFTMDAHTMQQQQQLWLESTTASQVHQEEGAPTSLPLPVTSGPPPTYESLIFDPLRTLPSPVDKKDESDEPGSIIAPPTIPSGGPPPSESEANRINKRENNVIPRDGLQEDGLPSYEAALKLEADGYV